MKKQNFAIKEIKFKGKKYKINIQRFAISLLIIIALISIVIKLTSSPKEITSSTNIDDLNASKYADQILKEYEKDGQKEKFLSDYEKVQTSVGVYILNNSTLDDNSFKKISKELNKDLSRDNWKLLDVTRPNTWNGTWSINDQGVLRFEFKNKDIEPSWKEDSNLQNKLILN